jgi:large subunit ribosomal protein L29
MAILRSKEIRNLSRKDIDKRLEELKLDIAKERANISIGATTTSPGKIKEIKRAIARINTIKRESAAGSIQEPSGRREMDKAGVENK